MFHYLLAVDVEMVKELLPLGDALVGGFVTLAVAGFTYVIGRRKATAEIDNLQAEKKSIEAASGFSTAQAAQVISEAAAATVGPLTERLKDQREEIKDLTNRNVAKRHLIDELKTQLAETKAENILLRRKFELQGEKPPEINGGNK